MKYKVVVVRLVWGLRKERNDIVVNDICDIELKCFGLGWWTQQPIGYIWIWPIPNPLALMSIPLMLVGGASALYGLITNGKNPHTKTLKTGHRICFR